MRRMPIKFCLPVKKLSIEEDSYVRETRQVLETASSGEKKLVSTPPDRKGMRWRVEAAFRKAERSCWPSGS